MYRIAFCSLLVYALLCSAADQKSDLKLSTEEQTLVDLTNEARKKEKLPPLRTSAQLFAAARKHSADMADKGEMSHVLDGQGPADRVKAAKYKFGGLGENVAFSQGTQLRQTFELWMDSQQHRENILNEKYQDIGIGVARNEKGEVYYVQVFGQPRD